ncbi:hypothetical protein RHGRI_005177 [Rhododendron griersonianum]|uniref:RING-type E3 ubiquitin transferase n=1 Tax=Rhododendron griersonianum TaxID=479676 RepID=A0AAV6LC27_9ERIC|nr:hypothetical protein RHGRI_005177 [Rhododendron griersonianum]
MFVICFLFVCWWRCTHQDAQEAVGNEQVEIELAVAQLAQAHRLDRVMIEQFSLFAFSVNEAIGFGKSECQLCQDPFEHGSNIRVLPACNHIFHNNCIIVWLTSRTHYPICRHDYVGWEPGV